MSTFHLTETEAAAIERNHTRLKRIPDRAQTLDMFATGHATGHATEELTLCGEIIRPTATATRSTTTNPQLSLL